MMWKRVDFPEPVLPAMRACWQVALARARYWSFVARWRPIGTRISWAVPEVQHSSGRGAMKEKGQLDAGSSRGSPSPRRWIQRAKRFGCGWFGQGQARPSPVRRAGRSRRGPIAGRGSLAQVVDAEAGGRLGALVVVDEEEDAAARPGRGDGEEALRGEVAEAVGEIRDDEEVVAFRDGPRGAVVFGDGRVVVAQVHLDHLLHVLAEFAEAAFDLV